jgi:hypothetical protein
MVAAVDSFFEPLMPTRGQHTDILTTLQIAGEQLRDSEGRASTLLLLSDMLQSAQGIEMEKLTRMPRTDWVTKQKRLGLIPNLSGACVLVVGADATKESGVRIRRFWQQYFDAAGSTLADTRYRATAPPADRNLCG